MVCSKQTDSYPCRKLVCSQISAAQSLLLTPGHHVGCCFPLLSAMGWLTPSRCGAVERWSSWLGHWRACSLGVHSWFWWCWFLVSWHRGAKEGHASLYQQQHLQLLASLHPDLLLLCVRSCLRVSAVATLSLQGMLYGNGLSCLLVQATTSHNLLNKPIKSQTGLEPAAWGSSRLIQSSSSPSPFEVAAAQEQMRLLRKAGVLTKQQSFII